MSTGIPVVLLIAWIGLVVWLGTGLFKDTREPDEPESRDWLWPPRTSNDHHESNKED